MSPTELLPIEFLVQLAQACESRQLAMFSYVSQGRHSSRPVEPHRLVATDRRWYLVAYDLERQDWRTFRVDRISDLLVPGHTFVPLSARGSRPHGRGRHRNGSLQTSRWLLSSRLPPRMSRAWSHLIPGCWNARGSTHASRLASMISTGWPATSSVSASSSK